MPPFNTVKTLFILAKETIGEVIVTECKSLEVRYATSPADNLTYDNPECVTSVQLLHDALLSHLPTSMNNSICEAALSYHETLELKIRDKRILYGILVSENLTCLKVRNEENETDQCGIQQFIPRLKNIVKLELGAMYSDSSELVVDISNTCEKLEDITLHYTTSTDAFRYLVTKCPKIRSVRLITTKWTGGRPNDGEISEVAITSLPNLEYLDYRYLAGTLESSDIHGPLKLRSISEFGATPSNVLAAVTKCPHVHALLLQLNRQEDPRKILDILTASTWKITQLDFLIFGLNNASAEKFFISKGELITELKLTLCDLSDPLSFINFIGKHCKNLENIYLSDISYLDHPTFSEDYCLDSMSENASFHNLKELRVDNFHDCDCVDGDRREIQMLASLMANAPSLEKIGFVTMKCDGYPTDSGIEQIFSPARIQKLQELEVTFDVTERILKYFMDNAPNLTRFSACETDNAAFSLMKKIRKHALGNNINITLTCLREDDDTKDESEDETVDETEDL